MKKKICTGIFLCGIFWGHHSLFAQATNKIDTVGYIGIGTLSPSQSLHVINGTKTNSLYVGSASNFSDRSGNGDNIYIRQPIKTTGGWWGTYIELQGPVSSHTASFYPVSYWSDENNDGYAETPHYYVDKNGGGYYSGKLGIGTSLPTQALHVANGGKFNSLYLGSGNDFSDRSGIGDNLYIRQPIHTSGGWWGVNVEIQGSLASHTADFFPFRYVSDENNDGTPETTWFYLNKTGGAYYSGNVGIGTTSPSEKLSVNGNISSKKSIVTQTGWSDYVFNDDYKLRPLYEVSKFIKDNKHLPEVPSAKEVGEHGLDLGANQALLLKKIEELTLYVIQQQKEIETLKKKVNKK